jgi:phosphoenolpyruvate phosphomutase
MIPVGGKPVLRHLVDKFKARGINDITVVGGYCAAAIDVQGVNVVVNEAWAESDELASLACALDAMQDDTVIVYGDLLFRRYILDNLLEWDAPVLAVVDSAPLEGVLGNTSDLAYCTAPDDRALYQQKVAIERVTGDGGWQGRRPDGRWVGIMRVSGPGRRHLLDALDALRARDDFASLGMPDLINRMAADGHAPQVQYIAGHWMDINDLDDLTRAGDFAYGQASG